MRYPTLTDAFHRCSTYSEDGPLYNYRCKLGLWVSQDTNPVGAFDTAIDLFREHYRAGAYDALLAKREDKP